MKKTKGLDSRTRSLFRKSSREKGLKSLRYLLEPYKEGDKVDIILNSQSQSGRPHRRYHASTGTIINKQGQAYLIEVKQGKRLTRIVAKPEHLRAAK